VLLGVIISPKGLVRRDVFGKPITGEMEKAATTFGITYMTKKTSYSRPTLNI
jgi:hypothetical protein